MLIERFRCCPDEIGEFRISGGLSQEFGYFRLGRDAICYGQCSSGTPAKRPTQPLKDVQAEVTVNGSSICLPFDPTRVIEDLHREQYMLSSAGAPRTVTGQGAIRNLYYLIRPLLQVSIRKHIQKLYFHGWEHVPFPSWPVDRTVETIFDQLLLLALRQRGGKKIPFIWFWPDGAPTCTIMTHDVETQTGVEFCSQLMDLNDSFGIKSSFQIVPEKRYPVPTEFLDDIRNRGFEINVQDLNHDGLLFSDRQTFLTRAERINHYGKVFGALGFRAGVLYRNTDWYGALDFSYDMSIPNVAHLDPQRGGCCTVMPFFIGKILELPVTTTQDYSLFNILNDSSIQLWKRQVSLIREKHGLISFIVHPDYIIDERARSIYKELLGYISDLRAQRQTWIALPKEVAEWWRLRNQMTLVKAGNSWRIQGPGSERARLAYAVLDRDKLAYVMGEGQAVSDYKSDIAS